MGTYVVYSPFSRGYKIGHAENIEERVRYFRTVIPDIVLIRGFLDNRLEYSLQNYFASARIKGEWFDLGKDGADRIDRAVKEIRSLVTPSDLLRIVTSLKQNISDDDIGDIECVIDTLRELISKRK